MKNSTLTPIFCTKCKTAHQMIIGAPFKCVSCGWCIATYRAI